MPIFTGSAQMPSGDSELSLTILWQRFLHLESLLSLPGYALSFTSGLFPNPLVASTTYYWGGVPVFAPSTGSANRLVFAPRAGVLRSIYGQIRFSGLGSAEPVLLYLRHNDTTDYLIASITMDAAGFVNFNNRSLAIRCAEGDTLTIKLVGPAWVTPPSGTIGASAHAFLEAT